MKWWRKVGTRQPSAEPLSSLAFDLLCLTVLCTLAAHAPHLPIWFTAILVVLVGARWWQRQRLHQRTSVWVRITLLIAIPVVVMAVYGTPLGHDPGAAIVCGLLVVKLLESEHARDARMAVGFSCFILMSALLFDQSLGFTIIVGLLLLPPLATLRALGPGLAGRKWLPAFKVGSVLLALSLPAALLGFVLIPRLATPLWGAPDSGVARTGVSDSMAPGELQSLLTDNAVAMRIGFDGTPPTPDQRYFRGMVLWHFDGSAWTPGVESDRATPTAPVRALGPATHYTVTLEATHQHWLFALDVPLDTPTDTSMLPDRTLRTAKAIDHTRRYSVTSASRYHLGPPQLDPRLRAAALQLPSGFDPRARALARQWRVQSGGDAAAIVRDALTLFHSGGFAYDLNAPPLGRNSVDDFLFDTKTGFCEHYSSAFTFLMRAAGVPSRVVVGYQGGYWNNVAHYLLLRQSDAHAWSEVWLAGRGWVRVDPTAVVSKIITADGGGAGSGALGDMGVGSVSWWLPWQNRLDIINRWWGQTVVNFDALRQSHLFRPFGIDHATTQMLGIALAICVFLALCGGALLASLRPRPHLRDPLAAAQARLQRRLGRIGIVRAPHEGPRDYYARSATLLPESAAALRALGDEYLRLRYGFPEPPPERARDFSRRVHDFHPRRVVK